MLGKEIWCDVASFLVLQFYLFNLLLVSNMVNLESDVARFGGDRRGSCQFNCGVVVFEHDRWRLLGVAEVFSHLSPMG